jgi:hypothetical protein
MTLGLPQNPGIGGLDELTQAEELFLTRLAGLSYNEGDFLKIVSGLPVWYSGGSTSWGSIGGTLSDQTDLQNILDTKTTKNFAIAMALALG